MCVINNSQFSHFKSMTYDYRKQYLFDKKYVLTVYYCSEEFLQEFCNYYYCCY